MKLEDLQIICISLAKRPDRWARIEREAGVATIPIQRMEAVDASTFVPYKHPAISLATAHNIYFKTRRSVYEIDAGGAVGCSLSHFKAWEQLLKSSAPAMLVFEDDCTIPADLRIRLEHMLKAAPADWDLIQLHRSYRSGCKPIESDAPWQLCTSLMGTHAYIVSRRGAERLLKRAYPIELHVDAYMAYMARLEHVRMLWHPIIDIKQRGALSDIEHGNARICSVPTNMDDRDMVALSVSTIVGTMVIAGAAGCLIGMGICKAR